MDTKTYIQNELNEYAEKGLTRSLRHIRGAQGARIYLNNADVLNFCSNNYLGLANDPRLCQAANECMTREGFGSGASRLICGNMDAHLQLENSIARFKVSQSFILFQIF